MERFRIQGPCRLAGRVVTAGAKNAALPALAASLLADEPLLLSRVPEVRDIRTMKRLLGHLGVESATSEGRLRLSPTGNAAPDEAPYELVKTMRASVLVLGPLVARAFGSRAPGWR